MLGGYNNEALLREAEDFEKKLEEIRGKYRERYNALVIDAEMDPRDIIDNPDCDKAMEKLFEEYWREIKDPIDEILRRLGDAGLDYLSDNDIYDRIKKYVVEFPQL